MLTLHLPSKLPKTSRKLEQNRLYNEKRDLKRKKRDLKRKKKMDGVNKASPETSPPETSDVVPIPEMPNCPQPNQTDDGATRSTSLLHKQ